jgi:MFS family permease
MVGRRPIIVLSFLGSSLLILTFSMTTHPSLALILWSSAVFMTGIRRPAIRAFYMDPIPGKFRGTVSGLLMGIAHIGMVIAPTVGGYFWETFGITMPFQISAALALLSIPIVMFWFPQKVDGSNIDKKI